MAESKIQGTTGSTDEHCAICQKTVALSTDNWEVDSQGRKCHLLCLHPDWREKKVDATKVQVSSTIDELCPICGAVVIPRTDSWGMDPQMHKCHLRCLFPDDKQGIAATGQAASPTTENKTRETHVQVQRPFYSATESKDRERKFGVAAGILDRKNVKQEASCVYIATLYFMWLIMTQVLSYVGLILFYHIVGGRGKPESDFLGIITSLVWLVIWLAGGWMYGGYKIGKHYVIRDRNGILYIFVVLFTLFYGVIVLWNWEDWTSEMQRASSTMKALVWLVSFVFCVAITFLLAWWCLPPNDDKYIEAERQSGLLEQFYQAVSMNPAISDWFYDLHGKTMGPVASEEIQAMIRAGVIADKTLLKRGANGSWQRAETIGQ